VSWNMTKSETTRTLFKVSSAPAGFGYYGVHVQVFVASRLSIDTLIVADDNS